MSDVLRRFLGLHTLAEQRDRRRRLDHALARAESRVTEAHVQGVLEFRAVLGDLEQAFNRYATDLGIRGYKADVLRIRVFEREVQ